MRSAAWPLNSDAWALELKLVADAGYRAIAHDRRGHGRSTKTYTGNDIDHYAALLMARRQLLRLAALAAQDERET